MAEVTYDDRSYLIDGERIWLVSGSVHYFRVPAELWRDRLLKAQRAGLNCICTYIPWNFHEPVEGQWRLDGDADIAEFIRIAGDLGLYVILRPGPYICSEWDFGGLPAWLTTKTGMKYRTTSAAYTHYFDRYFANMLPPLAEMQVTRGGNIILVQNENEYYMTTTPERLNHLNFITQLIRRAGFDVPIITCNWLSDPPVPDTIECSNTFSHGIEQLQMLRTRQEAPLMVSEFWAGWFDYWGGEHSRKDPVETARRVMEITGCGGQVNYYMFHGGTNFSFWGSRLVAHHEAHTTTSYDFDAPLAEGGGRGPKYYTTRLANLFARHMGPYIAQARMEEPGARMTNLPDVLNLLGPDGDWALVTSHGLAGQETAEISLLSGQRLTVPFGPLGAVAIPSNLVLDGKNVLAWTNCQPLGMFFGHVLVLHGPAGWQAAFRLNGKTYRETIDADAPTVVETPHLSVVLMTSELAMRSWPLEEEIVCGPDFVGETTDDIEHARGAKQYWRIKPGGKVTTTQVKSPGASSKSAKRAHPRLGKFQPLGPCPEPTAEDVSWQKLPGPQGVDKLGQYYGYVWYRVAWEAARARKPKIYLPHCEDRARLYLNGRFVGVWGQGPDATREPLSVSMRRGQNVLVALVDNMGRYNYPHWRLGELKGLTDHVWEAKPLRTRKFKLRQAEGFARRIVPRHMTHLIGRLEEQQVWQASLEIPLTTVTPLHMRFEGLPCTMAAFCNDRPIGFWEATGTAWGDVRLGPELTKGNNKITLTCWGELDAKDLERIKFYQLTENLTEEGQWAWRPWHVPGGEASPDGEARVLADVPAGFVTRFKYTEDDRPMFVRLEGEGKGQLYLNGKDVGRYWSIGPQQRYYLPACWLDEENELVLFEETGVAPTGGKLEFCPAGPYED